MSDNNPFNQLEYQNQFNRERYDRVNLMLPKGQKDIVKAHAKKNGDSSLNAFIFRAIQETMKRDNEKE